MKHSFKNLFYLVIVAMVLFSSCSSDEETPAPTIELVNPPAATANSGTKVQFAIKTTAQEKIEKILITEKVGQSLTTIHTRTSGFTANNTEDLFVYEYDVKETSGSIVLNFTVTDKKGKVTGREFTLTVNEAPAATPLSFEKTTGALIANKIGPDQSAFDLAGNARKGGTATDADMVNPSTVDNAWVKGWNGVRGTTFVKANSYDYANATLEAASAAFAAGTATPNVTNVSVGDIYIAKIKGGSHFAVIKITHADNDIPAPSNAEKIEFTYKKVAENSGQ